MRAAGGLKALLPAALLLAAPAHADECEEHLDSTFALIKKVIFERHGCTSAGCHSSAASAGGLDLSADVAFDNLVDQPVQSLPSEIFPGLVRVLPGNKGRSLLWLNLAGGTLPDLWEAPLRPMPAGGLPPLSLEELDLVRMWIEYGATRDGVVPGTERLFDACLPPPKPLKVEPLPPPPPGVGVQLRAPRQVLPPRSEREVCFVSYYDLSSVPAMFRGPGGETFRFKRVEARQDPLSHHAVVIAYQGNASIHDPVWGPFACRGGQHDGQPCEPTDLEACGAEGVCASLPVPSVACIGFGPGDASIGVGEETLFNTMASAVGGDDGVYDEAPIKGILVWNSHAFNVTDTPATLDMWINFEFAAPEEQRHLLQRFVDISAISKMRVPAYGTDEVCNHHVLPEGARVLDLTSHVHQRGKRFRVFEGAFACHGGPNDGQPCPPLGLDPDLPTADPCAGAPCQAAQPPRAGDCDGDLRVSVNEVVTGVNIALGRTPPDACLRFDVDEDGGVSIDELVAGVDSAIHPGLRDPSESLFYTSLTYADPLTLAYDPPKLFGGPHATPAERTLTYCALYDNGFTNPDQVKRNSRVPTNGSPCRPTHCAEGAVGRPCAGDADCDTSAEVRDGFCDACPVGFGVTTDDEMFVLVGSYILDY